MARKRHSPESIAAVLRRVEAGVPNRFLMDVEPDELLGFTLAGRCAILVHSRSLSCVALSRRDATTTYVFANGAGAGFLTVRRRRDLRFASSTDHRAAGACSAALPYCLTASDYSVATGNGQDR
jgi:hypothetical protein